MPDLRVIGLDVNPSTDPLRYPGALVTESCLLTGPWLYRLQPSNGARIGSWGIDLDGGPLGTFGTAPGSTCLDGVLKAAGVALMNDRYPVLAVGSNAAPGQLRHKFGSAPGVSDVVPLTGADIHGLAIGHSAHVSKAGYVPYVPIVGDRGADRRLFVLWLDADQVACIDSTEPNYHPTVISGKDFPITLESGDKLGQYALYRGRWGALRLSPDDVALPATTQADVYRRLAGLAWFKRLVPECSSGADAVARVLGGDESRRLAVRDAFASEGLVIGDRLPQYDGRPVPYGSMQ